MPAADMRPSLVRQGVLVHRPEPDSPQLIERPAHRPPVGQELIPGWKVCDYNLVRGNWNGEEYAYEVWVMPMSSDCC